MERKKQRRLQDTLRLPNRQSSNLFHYLTAMPYPLSIYNDNIVTVHNRKLPRIAYRSERSPNLSYTMC